MWVCQKEKGIGEDYTALQAAVKDDLWLSAVRDATVASAANVKRNTELVKREERRIDLVESEERIQPKQQTPDFFSCTAEIRS